MTGTPAATHPAKAPARTVLLAFLADTLIVLLFAVTGRASHGMSLVLPEFWRVAWPFLIGLAVAWAAGLVWKRPLAPLRSGLTIALVTVVVGMILRYAVVAHGAAPVSWIFVGITTGLLAVLFIGWRGIATWILRARKR